MPRVNIYNPPGYSEIYDELRKSYGGMMTKTEIADYFGISDKNKTILPRIVAGLPFYGESRQHRFRVADIAKRIAGMRQEAMEY